MDTQLYEQLKQQYTQLKNKEEQKQAQISTFRLLAAVIFIAFIAAAIYYSTPPLLSVSAAALLVFLLFVRMHSAVRRKIRLYQNLININENELTVINGGVNSYDAGERYINRSHPFTYDLDIFGHSSLFHAVNRTGTIIGRNKLGNRFGSLGPIDIQENQSAVKELSEKVNFRQWYAAQAEMMADKEGTIESLKNWVGRPAPIKTTYRFLFILLPIVCCSTFIAVFTIDSPIPEKLFSAFFFINLLLVGRNLKKLKEKHDLLSNISPILSMYGELLQLIEKENVSSAYLTELKEKLKTEKTSAAASVTALSNLLHRFDTLLNGLGSLLLNGFFLYHIHTLLSLEKWKKQFGNSITAWLEVISEFDALNSIANYCYNNPDFTMPVVSAEESVEIENLGHPLIAARKRICNDLRLKENKFIILTGSNMAGKSTFLRTVGINLILARMGAPVCATKFVFYPFDVFATMRINDSLQDNESFFYAELKRLQQIVEHLQKGNKTFVLLDEILRGTNSNDKREGTKGFIKKMAELKTLGIIATHDLTISQMEQEYSGYLVNKCFEVEIINDELYFDYKLKNGVCQKMSAAFLMQKMGII